MWRFPGKMTEGLQKKTELKIQLRFRLCQNSPSELVGKLVVELNEVIKAEALLDIEKLIDEAMAMTERIAARAAEYAKLSSDAYTDLDGGAKPKKEEDK